MKAEDNNFGELLKQYFQKLPKVGESVNGKVISLDNGAVRIDINGVITGVIRGKELFTESAEFSNIKVGEEVQATVLEAENENGEMELSFRAAGHQRVWDKMAEYMKTGIT